jgi:hypothetical protein
MSLKFIWLVLSAGGVVAAPVVLTGYLPEIGPAPLRFRAPKLVAAAAVVLPPLRMNDLVATNSPVPEVTAPPPLAASEPLGPFLPANSVSTNPVPPIEVLPIVPTQTIAPQMLLEFFRDPGTNGAGVVPGGVFLPPTPSSSATYRSK